MTQFDRRWIAFRGPEMTQKWVIFNIPALLGLSRFVSLRIRFIDESHPDDPKTSTPMTHFWTKIGPKMGHLLTQFSGQLRAKTGKKGSKNGSKNGQKRVRNTIPMTQNWVIGMVFRVHVLARVCLVASEKRDLKMYKIWNMTSIPMTSRPTPMTHFWTNLGPKMGHLLLNLRVKSR